MTMNYPWSTSLDSSLVSAYISLSSSPSLDSSSLVLYIYIVITPAGSLNDNEVPLVYLTRLLCSRFLLTGYQSGLVPDSKVRVSVKALALSCIGCILDIYPKAFLKKLHKTSTESGQLSSHPRVQGFPEK